MFIAGLAFLAQFYALERSVVAMGFTMGVIGMAISGLYFRDRYPVNSEGGNIFAGAFGSGAFLPAMLYACWAAVVAIAFVVTLSKIAN